eukprot:SAG31_NODE_2079_length_6498_cov_3.416159_8_plen_316_part_00
MVVGLAFTFAGGRMEQTVFFSVGFFIGAFVLFFGISYLMTESEEYSCAGLGIPPFLGGVVLGGIFLRVLGRQKVFTAVGFLGGAAAGYYLYVIFKSAAENANTVRQTTTSFLHPYCLQHILIGVFVQGLEVSGRDFMTPIVLVVGGIIGSLAVGRIEFIQSNILQLYSCCMGSLLVIVGFDYIVIAHMGVQFRPNIDSTTNTGQNAGAVVELVAGILLACVGYYVQITHKLDVVLVALGTHDPEVLERVALKAEADSLKAAAKGASSMERGHGKGKGKGKGKGVHPPPRLPPARGRARANVPLPPPPRKKIAAAP